MLKCIRIRSLQVGVRKAHNSRSIYQTSSVKHQDLSAKFAYPFTFEEADAPAGSRDCIKEQSISQQGPLQVAQFGKIKRVGMSENTSGRTKLGLKNGSFISRLSPIFQVPFDEGPFSNLSASAGITNTSKEGDVKVGSETGNT
jgi:hypothetical protein